MLFGLLKQVRQIVMGTQVFTHFVNRIEEQTPSVFGESHCMKQRKGYTMKRVLECMTWPVISVLEVCSVVVARAKLGTYDIDRLPVEDISGQLVGMVSTMDVANADHRDLVTDYMTREVISISPLASLDEAMKLLSENDVGGIPVTVDNYVVGVLTWADVDPAENDNVDAWRWASG